jgi:hypothetical protein
MSAIMMFVAAGAALTILAGVVWWTYALFTKYFARREAQARLQRHRQPATRRTGGQPWDHQAGARGNR